MLIIGKYSEPFYRQYDYEKRMQTITLLAAYIMQRQYLIDFKLI